MNGMPGCKREQADELTREITIKSAQLAIEVRDEMQKEQNDRDEREKGSGTDGQRPRAHHVPSIVAGSIGDYTCCIPNGSPYEISHDSGTSEEEYYSFH